MESIGLAVDRCFDGLAVDHLAYAATQGIRVQPHVHPLRIVNTL